jgi:DNA invertase Pin-like site-specific DNA recombinase
VIAAFYTRVSTADQERELQIRESRAYPERKTLEVGEVYQDAMSAARSSHRALNLTNGR